MIQKAGLRILNSFTHQNLRTFVDLCKEAGYPTDLGGYYLRQLVRGEYLQKGERGEYLLTPKGRRYLATKALRMNAGTPRLIVVVIATHKDGLVVLERNKQPFLARKEWPATAVRGGETAKSAVDRLLRERLGSANNVQYKGIFRRIDMYQHELFDDKVFLIHEATLTEEPMRETSNGTNLLINKGDLPHIPVASRSLKDIFDFAESQSSFTEMTYELDFDDFEPS